jgi:hypothetical protein
MVFGNENKFKPQKRREEVETAEPHLEENVRQH